MAAPCDVVICYHSSDDYSPQNSEGWVHNFKVFLELMLNQVLGSKPTIVTFNENEVNVSIVNTARVVIPVISKHLASSERIVNALEFSSDSDEQSVFAVRKGYIDEETEAKLLSNRTSYDLFRINPNTRDTEEFNDFFSPEAEKFYWSKIADLSFDIHKALLASSGIEALKTKSADKLNIYLANVGVDLSFQRSLVKRELERYGHNIFPQTSLPREPDTLKRQIVSDVEDCDMCIHLIGNEYGDVIDQFDQSIMDLQSSISAEKASKVNNKYRFSRLIWIKNIDKSASERQLGFIESIKRDIDTSESSEILQTPLEDFKNIIRQKIARIIANSRRGFAKESSEDSTAVYILYDQEDQSEVQEIKKVIEDSGYRVLLPAFEGQLTDLRERHLANLRELDAAVIYKGNVNNQWVMMKVLDVLKAPGFGRKKPMKGKLLISSNVKDLENSNVINQSFKHIESGKSDALRAFLNEIG